MPIVLRPMNGEELCRQKGNKVEKYIESKAPDLVTNKLQFKSAATYFLLRAITPAPENYN